MTLSFIARDSVRSDQASAAVNMGDHDMVHRPQPRREFRPGNSASPKKATAVKGHEAFLKALETSGADVQVEKKSSGDVLIGKIKHSDKYTITLQVQAEPGQGGGPAGYVNRVIFKHDISEFSALQARPEVIPTPETVQ